MINHKQPGKPTHRRDKIIWTFEPTRKRELFKSLIDEYTQLYHQDLRLVDIKLSGLYLKISLDEYYISATCYGDGWYVTLGNLTPALREKLFGDHNIDFIWTQQTDMVVDIMGSLKKIAEEL